MRRFVWTVGVGLVSSILVSIGLDGGLAEGASCTASGRFLFSGVARVTRDQTFFLNDDLKPTRAFVIRNDVVAIRNVKPYGSCALFIDSRGRETIGWLETNALKTLEDAGIQDLPGRWRLERAGRTVAVTLTAEGSLVWLEARLSERGKPSVVLPGRIELDKERGPAFTLFLRLDTGTECAMSGVFLGGFMRLFADAQTCTGFAGVYHQVRG
jgi:hypothetical protein